MIGHFGGKVHNLIEDYKKPKLNLFAEFQNTPKGILPNEELLVPLLNWFSNHKYNIQSMQEINTQFFYVNKSILTRKLFMNINKNIRFMKYPKKKVEENKLNFLIPYIQKYYNWSDREYDFYKDLIDLEDINLHKKLDRLYAFDKKECRILGIKRNKIKKKFEKVQKTRGYF